MLHVFITCVRHTNTHLMVTGNHTHTHTHTPHGFIAIGGKRVSLEHSHATVKQRYKDGDSSK
jgi:hypothetical protein